MKFITPVLTAACLSTLGCALKQPPQGAGILTENARANIPGGWSASSSSGKVVPGWIRSFGDTTLTAIVEDALARNPDLKAAAARVEASQSAVRVAAASLYPSIGLKGLRERQGRETQGNLGAGITPPDLGSSGVPNSGGGTDINTFDSSMGRWVTGIGIGASWEADVWGRVRSKKAAAKMDSAALEADYEYARQSLAASVVRAYISTIEAGQQAANAQETLALYEDYLKLTDARKKQGFSSEYEIAQLKSRMAGAEDSVYAAEAAQAQAIRAIEVVTSHYPSGKLKTRRTFPVMARSVPGGMPSELLERRPDLIAAERRFAAAFHRSNEARTARLPRFAISATGGLGSAQLDGIGVIDAVSWSLAGGVTQPIFFGG
jgi:outer membrane protein, multidrug efflux system